MAEPEMPPDVQRMVEEEHARRLAWFVAIVRRWPNFRQHIACAELGTTIATADMMGVDVESFLAELRRREPRPAPLVPPKGS